MAWASTMLSGASLQAVLLTLLAWAALLCAGLGGTAGAVSQTLAGKLAGSVQHLQRQGGTAQACRAVRREQAAVAGGLQVAEGHRAAFEAFEPVLLAAWGTTLPTAAPQAYIQPPLATAPRPAARHHTPPSRAPPLLA